MVWIRQEKGLTLIELLVSISILSLVLTIFYILFGQMSHFEKQNEESFKATHYGKIVLVELKNNPDQVPKQNKSYETFNDLNAPQVSAVEKDGTFKENKGLRLKLDVEKEQNANLWKITVRVINENGKEMAVTYGYIGGSTHE